MVPITFHSAVPVLFFCLLFSFSGLLLIMVATCLQCYLANACQLVAPQVGERYGCRTLMVTLAPHRNACVRNGSSQCYGCQLVAPQVRRHRLDNANGCRTLMVTLAPHRNACVRNGSCSL